MQAQPKKTAIIRTHDSCLCNKPKFANLQKYCFLRKEGKELLQVV
jgi:hypothetical protein